jgi:nicotinate-nucleotide pyrophosphorylase (carboxylating)
MALPDLFEALTADGSLDRLLAAACAEDLGDAGDVTTRSIIETDATAVAVAVARDPGVVSGLAAVPSLLSAFGATCEYEPLTCDGAACEAGAAILRLRGAQGPILTLERTLLNLMGRLCGIASLTRRYVEAVSGTGAVICETRKTTPGLRSLEKYAVRCGGATLHRIGLFDAALYKDNHLAGLDPQTLAAAVAEAAERARSGASLRFVEVEVDTLDQLEALLDLPAGSVDMILLDNMPRDMLERAAAMRLERAPGVLLEASGGIELENVREIAATGVDRISVGALTRGAGWLDIALEVEPACTRVAQ